MPKKPESGLGLGDIIPLIVLASPALGYYFFTTTPDNVITGVLALTAVPLLVAARIVSRRLKDPRRKDIPPPAAFWRTLHFQLPPSTIVAGKRFKVMIVHDDSSLAAAAQVQVRHSGPEWDVKLLPLDIAIKDPAKILPKELEDANAVYFCWTQKTRERPAIVEALNAWSREKTEVPVLMVNELNIPYDLNFASMAPADAGPAHLLAHSIARGKLWIQLATRLYSWSFWATVLCMAAAMALVYSSLQLKLTTKRLADRDFIDDTNFNKLALVLFEAFRREGSAAQNQGLLNSSLQEMANFTLNDIAHTAQIDSVADDHISVFRKVESNQPNGHGILVEVIGPRPEAQFYPDQSSIAGCAVMTRAFVLWEKECKQGAPAAWDTQGKTIGACQETRDKDSYSTIQLDPDHASAVCKYSPVNPQLNNRGILCFSPAVQTSMTSSNSDTAVCLVTPENTDFLHMSSTKSKLRMFSLIANSVPTNALVTPQERAEYETILQKQVNQANTETGR